MRCTRKEIKKSLLITIYIIENCNIICSIIISILVKIYNAIS